MQTEKKLTTPTDSELVETICPTCEKPHQIQVTKASRRFLPRRLLCPECAAEAKVKLTKERREQEKRQRESAWLEICPAIEYRETDRSRLNQEKLAEVLAWQYGPQGLLLIGPTRTGKTRMVFLLLAMLLTEGRKIRAFDCGAFGHEVGRQFRSGNGEDWMDVLCQAEVVFLDDVGKIPFTERAEAELFILIERRTSNRLPIIATLNMSGASLIAKASEDRGPALVARLREFCKVINFGKKGNK